MRIDYCRFVYPHIESSSYLHVLCKFMLGLAFNVKISLLDFPTQHANILEVLD